MRIAKQDIPVKLETPGAIARQAPDFGDASGYGMISGDYLSISAGFDVSPLLQGLERNLCRTPHWGYMLKGELTVTYENGHQEVVKGGDLFYWPPGHTVKVRETVELIMFSPQDERNKVIDHQRKKIAAKSQPEKEQGTGR